MSDNLHTGDLWGDTPQPASTVPEPQQETVETNTASPDRDATSQTESKPTPQESFAEMRAKTERLQRERDEYASTLQRIEQYALQQQQQSQSRQPEPTPEPELDDDDYVEAKHFKSKISHLEKQLNQFQQQQQSSSIEMQLRNKYPDFDKVMTYENISKLRELRPEMAQVLYKSKDIDPYNTAASTYNLLKEIGIHKTDTYEPERERAQTNFNKPQTASSLKKTDSALTHASEFSGSRLSEDRKKQIWADMQRNLRG